MREFLLNPRRVAVLVSGAALVTLLWLWIGNKTQEEGIMSPLSSSRSVSILPDQSKKDSTPAPALAEELGPEPDPPLTEAERHKQIDGENMVQIHRALMQFKEDTGHFPADLKDLIPDYLDAEHLHSPREGEGYNFEFRNTVFRDGRTWEEIKEVQRAEWGDVIPILRSFNHDDGSIVLNMSYGGRLYETLMNWEWDPNTLDVVDQLGWGPGLTVGEFTEVTVTDAKGDPVADADVWASGRHYSFDLPDRPYKTDANGRVQIPIGVDLDRTNLALRVHTADGLVAPSQRFPDGAPPNQASFTLTESQEIGGVALSEAGDLITDT